MSAPVAGKFQDHYEILGIDPKSDSDALQRAYAIQAQRFHPKNGATPDKEKFDAVNQAYEILSDAQLRKEFDLVKGVSQEDATPKFSGLDFFEALGREKGLRAALLSLLYDRRRINPFKPSLTMRHTENMLNATAEELAFVLWYMKQRGLVSSDDKSALQITFAGMDFLENNKPSPDLVMPFFKESALTAPKAVSRQETMLPAEEAEADIPAKAPTNNMTRFGQLGRGKPVAVGS
jgi:curved DNA-binding protein CbpA